MTLSFPVVPMRATLSRLPADDSRWAFEVKWDGYRTLAFIEYGPGPAAELATCTTSRAKYPELAPLGDGGRALAGPCSTASWSCSTTRAGPGSS